MAIEGFPLRYADFLSNWSRTTCHRWRVKIWFSNEKQQKEQGSPICINAILWCWSICSESPLSCKVGHGKRRLFRTATSQALKCQWVRISGLRGWSGGWSKSEGAKRSRYLASADKKCSHVLRSMREQSHLRRSGRAKVRRVQRHFPSTENVNVYARTMQGSYIHLCFGIPTSLLLR